MPVALYLGQVICVIHPASPLACGNLGELVILTKLYSSEIALKSS